MIYMIMIESENIVETHAYIGGIVEPFLKV